MGKLSELKIKKLQVEKKTTLSDGEGLVLEVTPTGVKRFYFRYKIDNKTRWLPLGYYPEMSLINARAEASRLNMERRNAVTTLDPLAERERIKVEKQQQVEQVKQDAEKARLIASQKMSFQQLYDRWFKVSIVSSHKDDGAYVARLFETDILPKLGQFDADEVTRQQISKVTLDVVERGSKVMAGRVLGYIRQMYGHAIGTGLLEHDPTSHLKKEAFSGRANIRKRYLKDAEIIYLLQTALPTCSLIPKYKTAIVILLATAARVGELMKAERQHIDLNAKTWFIPQVNSKNGNEHTIHLSDFAVSAFQQLFQFVDHPKWIFPNRDGSNHVCPKTLTKQITDRQNDSPLQGRAKDNSSLILEGGHWTAHDLRRTASTIMASQRISKEVIEKCLNHTEQDRMVLTYNQWEHIAEREKAFNTLGARLAYLSDPNVMQGEIIPFSKLG